MPLEAEQKEGRKKLPSKRWIAVVVAGLLIALAVIKITCFITAKPTISINYATTYNELTRPASYDPNDNAAPLYEEALSLLSEMPSDLPHPVQFRPDDASGIELRYVKAWMVANREALERMTEAARKPYCWIEWPSFNSSEIGLHMGRFRRAAFALGYQARLLAADGDMEGAVQSVTTIHRMASHMHRHGAMSSHVMFAAALSGMAQQMTFALLADHPLESDVLETFQRDLAEVVSSHRSLSLAGERIRLLDVVQQYFTDDGKDDGHLIAGKVYDDYRRTEDLPNELADDFAYLRHLAIAWRHPSRRKTTQKLEDLSACLETLARKTPWQLHQETTTYEDEIRKCIAGYYFLELADLAKSLGRTIEIHYRLRVSGDALITVIALRRYQRDKGRWPESLDTLTEDGYIHSVPTDPFSGNTLGYRVTGKTFVLYSFGADFDDDGGTPSGWGQGAGGGDQVFWPR